MPTPIDLTTLAAAKAWSNVTTTNTDAMIGQLITAASQQIISYIKRNPCVASYTEVRDGNDRDTLSLWNWPIISVSSLTMAKQEYCWTGQPVWPLSGNPVTVSASQNAISPGFIVDSGPAYSAPTRIVLVGYRFPRGRSNITITYRAGYTETFPEAQTIAGGTIPLNNAATFVANFGVSYASSGTALTLVASSPAAGQYTCSATGVYGFNAADNGQQVIATYQFGQVPYDLVQACNEIVGQDLRRRTHIDEDSVVVAQQNTNYSRVAIPRKTQTVLDTYRVRMLMA